MDEARLKPDEEYLEDVRDSWSSQDDTFGRVYQALLGCQDYMRPEEIAEIAGCSKKSARKHLRRLKKMGIAEGEYGFRRRQDYVELLEVQQIARDLSEDEIIDRVQQLEAREDELQDEFGEEDPDGSSVFEVDSNTKKHERMELLSEWWSIERDIQLYELAQQLIQNEGSLLPR